MTQPGIDALSEPPEWLESFVHSVRTWSEAYPTDIFHVPTPDEWKRLNEAAKGAGLNGIDAFSAASMRHVITRVRKDLEAALRSAESADATRSEPAPDGREASGKHEQKITGGWTSGVVQGSRGEV